ncbi:MAG: NAD(P)/FAD-dependent oxidoreductase [Thermostichales cyanobacterium DRC_bins_46]
MKVIIVGAGLAGLACAKVLQEQGWEIQVLEQQGSVGGRVQTDLWQGFRLDRGFQVLFTAYPAVRRLVNLPQLQPCPYRPGAILVKDGRPYGLGDPWRDWGSLLPSLFNPLVPWADKLRVLRLRRMLEPLKEEDIFALPEQTTADYLREYGFSQSSIEHFFRPFYRGILLDPELSTTCHLFLYYFQMLAQGPIITPALGMGAIPQQLAASLPPHSLQLNTPVKGLWKTGQQVQGVELSNGERLGADWVVWATDAPSLVKHLGLAAPITPRSVTTLYFSAPAPITSGPYLHLNAGGQGLINHCMELTQVSPSLAPARSHLLSVNVIGDPPLSDTKLAQVCQEELRQQWFPKAPPLTFLKSYRIAFAQFAQPVGIQQQLVRHIQPYPRLVLAGEYTRHSSIQGSLSSGEQAAQLILSHGS